MSDPTKDPAKEALTTEEMQRTNECIGAEALHFYRRQSIAGRFQLPLHEIEALLGDTFFKGVKFGMAQEATRREKASREKASREMLKNLAEQAGALRRKWEKINREGCFSKGVPKRDKLHEDLREFFSDLLWVGIDEESDSFVECEALWEHFRTWAICHGRHHWPEQKPAHFCSAAIIAAPALQPHYTHYRAFREPCTGFRKLQLVLNGQFGV